MQRKEFNAAMRRAIAQIRLMREYYEEDTDAEPERGPVREDEVETPEEPGRPTRRRAGGRTPGGGATRRKAPSRPKRGTVVKPPPVTWPDLGSVKVELDPESAELSIRDGSWINEGDWRHTVVRRKFGNMLLMLFVDQFAGFDATQVTWAIVNGVAGAGAQLFDSLTVTIGGVVKYQTPEGRHAIQVRGILARRHFVGPDAQKLAGYEHIEVTKGYPEWVDGVCEKGLQETMDRAQEVGIYRIGDPGVSGSSSMDGSHGGWKIAPWHMGPEGWQRGSRAGYQWAEVDMFDTLDRSPLASFNLDSLKPHNPHSPYWPGRANVVLPGFEEDLGDGSCDYLESLTGWRAHAYSHLHRETCAAAMLAPRDTFARWLLVEVYWHDNALWLDGQESDTNLFKTAKQIIRELPEHEGWSNGGRGLAHAIRSYLYARPYIPGKAKLDGGESWDDVLTDLLRHIARPNGTMHSTGPDDNHKNVLVACRAREVDLMYPNLVGFELDALAAKVRDTMAPIDGVHVAAAFDPRHSNWRGGEFGKADYYPLYDVIRRDSLELIDLRAPWDSTLEQLISMVPPDLARIVS